jgi:hypothetical protein
VIDVVALLLADRSPALRYRALVEVDGAPLDDPEVAALADELGSSDEVARVVAAVGPRARDASFALSRLAHLGVGRGHPAVDDLVERAFALQRADGAWPVEAAWQAAEPEEGYRWRPLQTAIPLRGICAAGYADDERAERAFEWLLAHRTLDDGTWVYGQAGVQKPGQVAAYRRLPQSEGCRATTTGVLACFAHHPARRTSADARAAMDVLLRRETREESTLGAELSRLVGLEEPRGFATFYARFDLAFVLELASRTGVDASDLRVAELLSFLDARRGRHGLWDHPVHPNLTRWLTLELLASRRRIELGGDWAGTDRHIDYRAYPKQRRRH